MYNTDFPTRAELPIRAQLKRSTIIAAASAALLLVTVIFPSEYGVDVTGVGRLLRLTEMGEIKTQLAQEAAADRVSQSAANPTSEPSGLAMEVGQLSKRIALLERALYEKSTANPQVSEQGQAVDPGQASSATPVTLEEDEIQDAVQTGSLWMSTDEAVAATRQDEMSVVLQPGEGTEIKMVMDGGAKANFWWSANGRLLNYDAHGDGGGQSVSYDKGRGIGQDEGVMTASFSGNHGWFWRNRSNEPVTLTLRTSGAYSQLKRMK